MASGPALSLQIGADSSGLKQELGQAASEVRNFGRSAQDTASQVESQVEAQVRSLATAANYKKELRAATMEVQNLTMAYRQLTEEQRNSGLGTAIAEQLNAAKARAAELKDAIGDLNDEIKNMASDTSSMDAINQGLALVRDGMSAFIAVTGMAGADTAKFEQVVKDVGQVMLTMNAIISATNALQKQSALMTGIRNLQDSIRRRIIQQTTAAQVAQNGATVAGTASATAEAAATTADATAKGVATAATVAQTAATVKLTAAQKIFNIVAAANPYVLLATVILGVGAALYGLISASHDATD